MASRLPRTIPPQLARLWGDFHSAALAECAKRHPRRPPAQYLFLYATQLVLLIAVTATVLWINRADIMGYIDGQYVLTLHKNQGDFASRSLVFSSNPMQAIGDLWYTTANTRWIPELAAIGLFSAPDYQKVAVHVVACIEMFTVVFFVAYWLHLSPEIASASAWLVVLLIAPLFFPALLYNIQTDNPEFTSMITFPLVVMPVWAGVGRGTALADAVRIGVIAFLFWVHLIATGLATILDYPFLAITSLTFLAMSWPDRSEFWRKVIWGSALLVFLVASGLPQILLGLIVDSAFHVFPKEMTRADQDLSVSSILFRTGEPAGVVVAVLGIAGATFQAIYGDGNIRRFAISTLILVGLILAASVAIKFGVSGPAIPIYYEVVLWAVYPIFAVTILSLALKICWAYFSELSSGFAATVPRWVFLALPWTGMALLHGQNYSHGLHNDRPNVYPPTPTAISELLRGKVGFVPGGEFRGRATTNTGQILPPKISWDQLFGLDMGLIRAVGNEHRTIGLWYYSIPTLTELTVTFPPLFYALAKRYLAYEDDIQGRAILTMRWTNLPILQLLGVRYVITDSATPSQGARRVLELPIPTSDGQVQKGQGMLPEGLTKLGVDEIPAPNLGMSPTKIVPVADKDALDWLGRKDANFRQEAILAGPPPGDLNEARNISITIERGGIRVRANATGQSLVVIPFQFSNCLKVTYSNNAATPELRRADFILTGILFHGDLDATIQYRQGPFQSVQCRLDDRRDASALLDMRR